MNTNTETLTKTKTRPEKPLDRYPRTRDEGRDVATRFLLTEKKAPSSLRKSWKATRDAIIEIPAEPPRPTEDKLARKASGLNFRQLMKRARRALRRHARACKLLRDMSPDSRFYKPVEAQKEHDALVVSSTVHEISKRTMDRPRGDEPHNMNSVTGTSA